MPLAISCGMIFVVSLKAISTIASGFVAAILLTSAVKFVASARVQLLATTLPPPSLIPFVDLVGETLAVGVLAGQDADVRVAVLDDQVAKHRALQHVRRRGPEVQALVVVGVERRRRCWPARTAPRRRR